MSLVLQNKIIFGDCLKQLKNIQSNSIDLILTDLPYGLTQCSWDSIIPFNLMWDELKRVTKNTASLIFTSSQPFTSALIMSNPKWFSHSWIWEKEQGVNFLLANKQPLKIHEDIIIFQKPGSYNIEGYSELRNIFDNILEKIGKNKSQMIKEFGYRFDHCFRTSTNQWELPTKKNYEFIINKFNLTTFPNYDSLLNKYHEEFFRIYNPQLSNGSPYISGSGNSGEVTGKISKVQTMNTGTRLPTTILKINSERGQHPTQKPVKLFEYLIKTYTYENNIVLDCCAGSGTTAIACMNTNRNYICIEKDEKYFKIMQDRIVKHCEKYNKKLEDFLK